MAADIEQRLRKAKIFTIDTLKGFLKCSSRTAWRRLSQWKTYTSYNQNAKYHVLSDIPQFDSNGIWRCEDVYFSRYGNLTKTITHIVGESQGGLEAQKLCSILGVSAPSLYTHFRGIKEIYPQRIGRHLVFFSSRSDVRSRQMAQRSSLVDTAPAVLPRSSDAVLILVDRIQHPDDSIEQCAQRLRHHSLAITLQGVQELLTKYGIEKKTADMR